jgi:hypothetical protein
MADKKEIKLGGQAGVAQKALGGRQSRLEALEMEAMGGGPSGKDKAAAEGSTRLTTDDKRIK